MRVRPVISGCWEPSLMAGRERFFYGPYLRSCGRFISFSFSRAFSFQVFFLFVCWWTIFTEFYRVLPSFFFTGWCLDFHCWKVLIRLVSHRALLLKRSIRVNVLVILSYLGVSMDPRSDFYRVLPSFFFTGWCLDFHCWKVLFRSVGHRALFLKRSIRVNVLVILSWLGVSMDHRSAFYRVLPSFYQVPIENLGKTR